MQSASGTCLCAGSGMLLCAGPRRLDEEIGARDCLVSGCRACRCADGMELFDRSAIQHLRFHGFVKMPGIVLHPDDLVPCVGVATVVDPCATGVSDAEY